MLIRAFLVAVVALGTTLALADQPGGLPEDGYQIIEQDRTDLLLDAIVLWLSRNSDLPEVYAHPELRLVSDQTLTVMHLGHEGTGGAQRIEAVYDPGDRVMYLSDTWTNRTPAGLSMLVHEMVHHLQTFEQQKKYACPEEREEPAYAAQEKWLGLFGRSIEQDFEINPLTLKMLTACFLF
ncbi:MAG: hypothetical protein GY798_13360 [Hyphomicrobiales bacterium]|nr:hypothetical protein [Hyphomicrobiales bacterium]